MLIDSHCHLDRLDLSPFEGSFEIALQAAEAVGVKGFLCVAIDHNNQQQVVSIAEAHPNVWASIGVHPLYCGQQITLADNFFELSRHPKVIAVGETGLDYYYGKDNKAEQRALFEAQVQAAVECQLPIIVHTRDARQDTLAILQANQAHKVGGVLHCFTESQEMAEAAIEMGFYISFSGIVTFKNAKSLQQVAKDLPLKRILVETDSPYLTPVPFRGKPNSPRHVADVARFLAALRGESFNDFCSATTKNFFRLFTKAKASLSKVNTNMTEIV